MSKKSRKKEKEKEKEKENQKQEGKTKTIDLFVPLENVLHFVYTC